jgi:hypothetical protein
LLVVRLMETDKSKQYLLSAKECLKYIHDFEFLYQELLHCKPFKCDDVPKGIYNQGSVYAFCKDNQIIYVGYASKALETSIRKQLCENKVNLLAWKLFYDRYKILLTDYSKQKLNPKKIDTVPEFHSKLQEIKEEIKSYQIKAVKLRGVSSFTFDITQEALFEIYVSLMSKAKYNDFECD